MEPRIEISTPKKLIGKQMTMSLSDNKTGELWKRFMQQRHTIQNKIGTELYSVQEYDHSYFSQFRPDNKFIKWATVEVADFSAVPDGMGTYILSGGQYAVFTYKGSSRDNSIFQYIFSTWLPNSKYELDNRPHFEVLGEKYKNEDPDSEEEIWIPVKQRS